jgi:hypothetical protein
MNTIDRLSIAEEFSRTPGPRSKKEGPFSAEEFWEKLVSRFENAMKTGGKLLIDMDGAAGYGTSFIDGTFGGLARQYTTDVVKQFLDVKCDQDTVILEEVWENINNPYRDADST